MNRNDYYAPRPQFDTLGALMLLLIVAAIIGAGWLLLPAAHLSINGAPAQPAAAPTMTTQQRLDRLYAAPSAPQAAPPSAPAPTPVPAPVIAAPAPVVAPDAAPAEPPAPNPQVIQAIKESAPIIIIPRNGSSTTIGGGACAVARGARRCGK